MKLEIGFNDLESQYPELLPEWDYEKNEGLLPSQITAHSSLKVWWKCKNGHEWLACPSSRTYGNGCPVCTKTRNRITDSFADFSERYPSLAKEWNKERNQDLEDVPDSYSRSSNVWWKCRKCGCEWQMTIGRRRAGGGCPNCSGNRSSIAQLDLSGNLIATYSSVSEAAKAVNGKSSNISYCLNGKTKTAYGYIYIYIYGSRPQKEVLKACPPEPRSVIKGVNDLETLYPDIAKEWNKEKNADLKPSDIPATKENLKVWWTCPNGHEYLSTPGSRTSKRTGCPYCSGRKLMPGYNDLASVKPELAAEWNYERNGELSPSGISCRSDKSVWWKCCKCGNEWKSRIIDRRNGNGCAICKGSKPPLSFEQFLNRYPLFADEWNHEKNEEIENEPDVYSVNKVVWWKCRVCGKEWRTRISSRIKGSGCPQCARKSNGEKISKAVAQFDLDGGIVHSYASIRLAAESTGIPYSSISSCLRGRIKAAGGYIWRYSTDFQETDCE